MTRAAPIVRDYRAVEPQRGPLLRGGRVVVRVVLVWALVTAALHLLDLGLTGFAMDGWWQPVVCALLFGLLTAVVWPLVLRVALPLALFTLGLGSFLLLAAASLAIFSVVPGVTLTNLRTALVVAVVMTVVNAAATSLLAIDEDELFFRRTARRSRRAPGSVDTTPGVLFLQIDGLGHETVRRAVRDGTMPVLARWLAQGTHTLAHWTTDWSSQRPARA